MSRGQGIRKALLAGCAAFGLMSTAFAQTSTPTTGLGQAWPNAADVSSNAHWHVYVFYLNGVKYVQVNDLNGTVHAAVGTAGGTTIVLPVGVDAQNVTTSAASTPSSSTVTVYSDSSTTVTATPQNNGTTLFSATPATQEVCQGGYSCGGGRGG
ncbi:hypothetical protein [Dyella sp.]|uniref:hypothetical protein n=1 Tax=Dyella sp. TaxID=1869338 RepID=UPI002B49E195|nr:hypothetical protein [Dyella sp.]HKT28817.1 hypothetical protein [Dyella sp.]